MRTYTLLPLQCEISLTHLNISPSLFADGSFVSPGNFMSVQFYGEQREFEVVKVMPVIRSGPGVPFDTSPSLSDSTMEESLGLDMSGLLLQTTPIKVPDVPGDSLSGTHGMTSTPKHEKNESTPQECGTGMESGHQPCSETEPDSELTQEQNYTQFSISDVIVYKITSKTTLQFTEDNTQEQQVFFTSNSSLPEISLSLVVSACKASTSRCGGSTEADSAAQRACIIPSGTPRQSTVRRYTFIGISNQSRYVTPCEIFQASISPMVYCCMVQWGWGRPCSLRL